MTEMGKMDAPRLFAKESPTLFVAEFSSTDFDDVFEQIYDHAIDNNATVRRVRGKKSRSNRAFFDEIGAVFEFPLYFGENWAALEDMARELSWLPATLIVIPDSHLLLVDEDERELNILLRLFDQCNEFYLKPPYDEGGTAYTGFHVLLQSDSINMPVLQKRLEELDASFAKVELAT